MFIATILKNRIKQKETHLLQKYIYDYQLFFQNKIEIIDAMNASGEGE